MLLLFNKLFPMFGTILLGFIAGKLNLLEQKESATLNKFVYFIAFPSLLFVVLARASIEEIFYWEFLFAWASGLFLTFIVTAIISHIIWRESLARLSLNCLNTTCPNTAFIGVFLLIIIFGEKFAVAGIISTAFLVIIIISLSIFLVEYDNGKGVGIVTILQKIGVSLAKNPLLIGALLGILASLLIKLPDSIDILFDTLGLSAIPISLFVLGLFFAGQNYAEIKHSLGKVNTLIFIKLALHPAITWILIDNFFALDSTWTAMTVILACLPPAITCFVIAQRYDVCVSETASMAVLSTIYSMVTIPIVLVLLGIASI